MPTGNNPIHSDFIIHWTGKDIEGNINGRERLSQYLLRLKLILRHGLWMTLDEEEGEIDSQSNIARPIVSRTCFTELKISEVDEHAKKYGRLGIGFKRFFLFNHLGCPMVYYPTDFHGRENYFFPPLFNSSSSSFRDDDYFSCFLKPMYEINSDRSSRTRCNYSLYDESEWRIIFSEEIRKRLIELGRNNIADKFLLPVSSMEDLEFKKVYETSSIKPNYLIPFSNNHYDGHWFAMIIYPDNFVKLASESDEEIRSLLQKMKPCVKDVDPSKMKAFYERNVKPIEISLESCKNF